MLERRRFDLVRSRFPAGQIAAQQTAPLVKVGDLRAVRRGSIERRVTCGFFGDWDFESRAEMRDLLLVQLLLLVRDVAALARFAQAVTLDRVRQNQRGAVLRFD